MSGQSPAPRPLAVVPVAAPPPGPPSPPGGAERESMFGQLASYLGVVFRHKWLVLAAVVLGTGAGYAWLQEQVPVYKATSRLMIDLSAPKILNDVSEVVELGTPRTYGGHLMYFESQYEIIRSRDVAEKVLDRLGLWQDERLLGLSERSDLTEEARQKLLAEADMPSVLAKRIQVEPLKKSMLVDVGFEDPDPELALKIVNAVAEAYREQNVEQKKRVVGDATGELERLRTVWGERLAEAEAAVRAFEVQHSVGTIPNTKKAIEERLASLSAQLTEARVNGIKVQAKANALARYTRVKDIDAITAPEILSDDVFRKAKQQIDELEAKLEGLRVKYLEKHPEILTLEKQADWLRKSVKREVQNRARSAQQELTELQAVEKGLEVELAAAKEEERRVADIERDYARLVEVATQHKAQHESINKRFIETTLSAQVETNNIRVLEPAVTAIKVRPRPVSVLVGAAFAALLVGLLLAFVVEFADASVKDWADLEERFHQKVLGVLPAISREGLKRRELTPEELRKRDFHIRDNPTSHAAEAIRTLRTNLLFMATTSPVKSLLLTSADTSEGKSTVSIGLAVSMAASGSKVLLVEADMRRPRLAKSFQVDRDRGLTTWLMGSDDPTDHVQPSGVDNLDLLVCGPMPPNPAELLHTERFREVHAAMRARYDFIIFDSPPVLAVADPLVLASQIDGCLVVVRAGRTSRHALRATLRQLGTVNARMLGVVLNHREKRQAGYRDGYSSYGYGYRYASTPYAADPATGTKGDS